MIPEDPTPEQVRALVEACPLVDTEMLRRAAEACRNLQKQAPGRRKEWFDWVPQHLEWLAARAR